MGSGLIFAVVLLPTLHRISGLANPVKRSAETCSILINGGLAEPQPLILWPGTSGGYAIPSEVGTGSVVLDAGESLRLSCLGTSNTLNVETIESVAEANVTCVSGTTFYFDDPEDTEEFESIACTKYPTHTARRTGVACPNGELCEIGFDFGDDEDFQTLMTACHDDVNHHTILVHARIPAVIDSSQTSFPRPSFVKGDFYVGISMSSIYTKTKQRSTLTKILGSSSRALAYIPTSGTFYFAKGHLAAKTDFIYGSHQRSTFYYLNTVPMWQNVNAGNWGTMEANVRSLATAREIDLDVWTGSLGILELTDDDGVDQEIHLYIDDNDNRAVPVPKLLFKIVYDEQSQLGIVFVVVNNPYLEELTSDYVVCPDICHNVTYLTWNLTRTERGLGYCCEIDQFRKSFPDFSEFETLGILV